MILAIDTSQPLLSIALLEGDRTLAVISLRSEGARNEKLLPLIDLLFEECGRTIADVSLFAVTRGPGSFTGTRIGLAMVQGLALATGRPICAMSSHEAAAWSAAGVRLLVSSDAGRGEFYVSIFENGSPAMEEQLADSARRAELAASCERQLDLSTEEANICLAFWLGRKAAALGDAARDGRFQDVTPIYVRLAEAEVKLRADE